MNEPLAFFFTWRTYGTWMHGHPLGSVDEAHRVYGSPFAPEDAARASREAARMAHAELIFDADARRVADGAIRAECEFRRWTLLALAVRGNHVHAVIVFANISPESMARRLKGRVTRCLRQEHIVSADQPVWASGVGSRKYLWTERDVADAVLYVTDYQDEPRR